MPGGEYSRPDRLSEMRNVLHEIPLRLPSREARPRETALAQTVRWTVAPSTRQETAIYNPCWPLLFIFVWGLVCTAPS